MNDEQVIHAMCLDDAYQVERVLAQGAGGTTELVSIHGVGPFVRKKMRPELANRRIWLALADRPCARLPRVQATYELPDRFVVVYDYVPGQTLEAVVAERGPLPAQEAAALAQQVCEAVGSLHDLGIVHRDVSPANIVVAADGAHLIDLGIARLHVADAPRDTTSLGTWGFASPEQYGFAQTDARSDVYAIGRLLGYMLTGLLPDANGYADALVDEKLCPPRLRAVVEQACAFEPSARYQSVAELVAALSGEDGGEGGVCDREDDGGRSGVATSSAEKVAANESAADKGAAREMAQPVAQRGRRASVAMIAGVAVFLALVGGGIAVLLHQTGPGAAPDPTAPATSLPSTIGATTSNALDTMRALTANSGAQLADTDSPPAHDAEPAGAGGSFATDIATMATYAAIRDTSGEEAARDFLASQGIPEDAFASDDAPSAGGGASGTHAETGASTAPENALEIVDSCWSHAANGLIHYSVALKNTSVTQRIEYPAFQIVGRDADGSVLFADEMVLAGLEPGETQWYGSVAGSGAAPTTVEFAPVEPDDWQWERPSIASASYAINGLREVTNAFTTLFTGEVACTRDDGVDSDDLLVTVVLRDEDGAVVYSASSRLDKPAEGASAAFQINASGCPAEYASMEAYAYTC